MKPKLPVPPPARNIKDELPILNKDWLCKLGIHKWRDSVTFSNAVPLHVRQELGTTMKICTRCFKVKQVKYE